MSIVKENLQLEQLSCPDCAGKIGTLLEKQPGVIKAEVKYISSKVKIEYDDEKIDREKIIKTIRMTGYKVME